MSQENVELLRRMFELFSHREMDWDAVIELLDPDIVWEVRSDFPDAGVYSGHEGVRQLSESFDEAVEQTWYRPLEYIDTGDRVVVPLRWGGLGIGSGAAFAEHEETWVFTLRDGRIRHVSEYANGREALETVGCVPRDGRGDSRGAPGNSLLLAALSALAVELRKRANRCAIRVF